MTSRWGRRLGSARTAVDLGVPRSPRMRTPPIAGLIALRTSAVFIASCPTSAVNGSVRPRAIDLILPAAPRCETERGSAGSRVPVVEKRRGGVQFQSGSGRAHGPVTGMSHDGTRRLRWRGEAAPLHPGRAYIGDGCRRLVRILCREDAETGRIR